MRRAAPLARAWLVGVVGLGLGLGLAWSAPPAAAQTEPARGDSVDLRRHEFLALAVTPHPWSTVVAVTLVLPRGSADEPRELPGSAWLLGETLREVVERELSRVGATVAVRVERGRTTFQALAAPGAWREALEMLAYGVFVAELDGGSLERRRAELRDVFRFESGSPSREFQEEFYALVGGSGGTWSREPRGTLQALERITRTQLRDLRQRLYVPEEAVVTLVGALDAEPGVRVFPGAGMEGDAGARPGSARGGSAWSGGRRQRSVHDVTNIWIGAAFPARRDVPRTILEFVALRLKDELNPLPRDPGLFGADVRLEELPEGPVILVEAAIFPEHERRWEERITQTVESLAERYSVPAFFELHRRQFRNLILTREGAPEAEGLRIALDLLRDGRARDLHAEIEALTPELVSRALATLGQPRILVFGPDFGEPR